MRSSEFLIPTLKEIPKDAEATSHVIMLRSGMIRKLASGFYSYLPLGFKVLKKAENIVRDEMNRAGAIELLMPAVHPADLWKKAGRYDVLADIFMKVQKGEKEYVLGPTHEEVITELASAYISSYKDLPKTLYQIQNKFRYEARPRFGVLRSREFIMKDAYSFNRDDESLDKTYAEMYAAYERIFERAGLSFVVVEADTGPMGGNESHEFMVLVDFGEDRVVLCDGCGYSASVEVAECKAEKGKQDKPQELEAFSTPKMKTIEEVSKGTGIDATQLTKNLIYQTENETVLCMVRGDHEICEPKLAKVFGTGVFKLAEEDEIQKLTGVEAGFVGPVDLKQKVKIIADQAIESMSNFVVGANKKDEHLKNVNHGRDFKVDTFADIREAQDKDPCPRCDGKLDIQTSLEIGHVFKLGTKYTDAFDGQFLDEKGKSQTITMGCYGIGVNRIVASCIEQHYSEENGMVWPLSLAPFEVNIITANQSSKDVVNAAEKIYSGLITLGVDVLYDDRNDRLGEKFKNAELVGAPFFIVLGDKGLADGNVEVRNRLTGEKLSFPPDQVANELRQLIEKYRDESYVSA